MTSETTPVTDSVSPRLAPFTRFGTVFGWGIRRSLRTKKFTVTLTLAAFAGAGLALVVRAAHQPEYEFWAMLDNALLAIAIPLVALALVAGGYGEEIQDQTLVYHLVRPVSRRTVFLARYASGILPGVVAGSTLVVAACLASGLAVSGIVVLQTALAASLGVATVGALYYALAALFRRGLVAGLVYTFVVEGFFQAMPGSVHKLSLMFHVRSLFHRWTDDAFATLSPAISDAIEAAKQPSNPMLRMVGVVEEPWTSALVALTICVGVVAGALILAANEIAHRDFALKD